MKLDEADDTENSVKKVAKSVIKESKAISLDRTKYQLNIDRVVAGEAVSETLQSLLAAISPKLKDTLPALMIGNIVTSMVCNQPTDLQISIGVLLRRSKTILGYLHDFGVTCSYHEVLCFKKSAAIAAGKDPSIHGISNSDSGLVQTVVDNFDTDIFVMLCHFVSRSDITGHVMMVSPIKGRSFIDINTSVDRNRTVMSNLLAAHGVTGCDTVATYHRIGKGVALKVLRSNKHTLSSVGDVNSSVEDAVQQATKFMLSCYGHPECGSMTEARQKIQLSHFTNR